MEVSNSKSPKENCYIFFYEGSFLRDFSLLVTKNPFINWDRL